MVAATKKPSVRLEQPRLLWDQAGQFTPLQSAEPEQPAAPEETSVGRRALAVRKVATSSASRAWRSARAYRASIWIRAMRGCAPMRWIRPACGASGQARAPSHRAVGNDELEGSDPCLH